MKTHLLIAILIVGVSTVVMADGDKKASSKKVQKVDFEGDTVDGSARTPDGAFVAQKRGVDFVPLYKVREGFDESIRGSVEYLK